MAGGKCAIKSLMDQPYVSSPLFVMPRTPAAWGGAAALWVTTAGWADAERRRGGRPELLTPAGIIDFGASLQSTAKGTSISPSGFRQIVPQWARQTVRDGQRALAMSRYRRVATSLLESSGVSPSGYVWQHHELFHRAGDSIADSLSLPIIEYVHAPIVWEARRWGVGRPGTATLLERLAERPQLERADLIACVSDEVELELHRWGISEEKTVVAPMGVDIDRFSPESDADSWRERDHDLGDFVLVWAGSLRRFHHVELGIEAVGRLRGAGHSVGLVIAGDGQDRSRLEGIARQLGVSQWVRFVGQIPATEMPSFLNHGDAALVTGASNQEFHYSPLKLREYLAMALPVVVPRLGEMERMIEDGRTGVLYDAGDVDALVGAIRCVAEDASLRGQLGRAGRELVADQWTWDAISERCLRRLGLV